MIILEWGAIAIAGESSLIVYAGRDADPETTAQLQSISLFLKRQYQQAIVELIPSYVSLLVVFDPLHTDHNAIIHTLENYDPDTPETEPDAANSTITLPVLYNKKTGPDLVRISKLNDLPIEQIIEIHQSNTYQVFALGFAPGFAYLGEVDSIIATPRLENPRIQVPRGSVGIADRQTAVYPGASPGGWNIVGCCPTELFNHRDQPPTTLQPGDTVRFRQIGEEEFFELGGEIGVFR